MPDIIIKLEKEDIVTSKIGENIMIKGLSSNIGVVLTPEALEELISDYKKIKNWKD